MIFKSKDPKITEVHKNGVSAKFINFICETENEQKIKMLKTLDFVEEIKKGGKSCQQ